MCLLLGGVHTSKASGIFTGSHGNLYSGHEATFSQLCLAIRHVHCYSKQEAILEFTQIQSFHPAIILLER